MKKFKNAIVYFVIVMFAFFIVSCGLKEGSKTKETITLASTILGEVEFENDERVSISRDENTITVSGKIAKMSPTQISEFGVEDVNYVVVLKVEFDKERTISSFEIQGKTTKVYSDDETDVNYVGPISGLLDSEEDEDAYCFLILSAETRNYKLISKYSDTTSTEICLNIDAELE